MNKILLMRSISTLLLSLLLVPMLPIQQAQAASLWDILAMLVGQQAEQMEQTGQQLEQAGSAVEQTAQQAQQLEQAGQAAKQAGQAVKQQV